jgi:ribose-phosphate pyrophosphokinase
VKVVKENGARDVYLAFVHAIFSADAAQNLAALPLKRIITTDTVPISADKLKVLGDRLTVLSVSSLLGEVIRRAHEGRSVGEMFNE